MRLVFAVLFAFLILSLNSSFIRDEAVTDIIKYKPVSDFSWLTEYYLISKSLYVDFIYFVCVCVGM